MTKHQQTELLEAILFGMKTHLMSRVEFMPENWDGIELRQYCADEFTREVRKMDRRRMRSYRNDVMTRPL